MSQPPSPSSCRLPRAATSLRKQVTVSGADLEGIDFTTTYIGGGTGNGAKTNVLQTITIDLDRADVLETVSGNQQDDGLAGSDKPSTYEVASLVFIHDPDDFSDGGVDAPR